MRADPSDYSDTGSQRERLHHLVSVLPADEIDVLASVAEGLDKGLRQYGPLHLDTDSREFLVEAVEEFRDATVYLTGKLLKLMRALGVGWRR